MVPPKMKASVYFQNQVNHAVPNVPDEVTAQLKPPKASKTPEKSIAE